jgi:hypothetical protein
MATWHEPIRKLRPYTSTSTLSAGYFCSSLESAASKRRLEPMSCSKLNKAPWTHFEPGDEPFL